MYAVIPFVLLAFSAAVPGMFWPPGPWYAALTKPVLTPPGWIFAPVWLILYLAIALAGWLVWRSRPTLKNPAPILWGVQLAANALWTFLFFGLQNPALALADIVVLLGAVLAFIRTSARMSMAASGLFVPYALWVGFAAYLNAGIVFLN